MKYKIKISVVRLEREKNIKISLLANCKQGNVKLSMSKSNSVSVSILIPLLVKGSLKMVWNEK